MFVVFRIFKKFDCGNNEMEVLVKSVINRDFGLGILKYSEFCFVIAIFFF